MISRYFKYKKTYEEYRKKNIHKIRELINKKKNMERFGFYKTTEEILKITGETCYICGISNKEHKIKYGKCLGIHHKDGNGRNQKTKKKPKNILHIKTLDKNKPLDGTKRDMR